MRSSARFDEVSILFADLVGFTKLSSRAFGMSIPQGRRYGRHREPVTGTGR